MFRLKERTFESSIKLLGYQPEVLPSFLALFECDPVGVSAFLFTAIDVLEVVEAAAVVVVAVDEADFVVVMGFIVAETGFTGAISTFSGVLSEVLKTEQTERTPYIITYEYLLT